MNRETPIGAQKRRLPVRAQILGQHVHVHRQRLPAGHEVQRRNNRRGRSAGYGRRGGWSASARSGGGRGGGAVVVRPRRGHHLGDADVAAVPPGLGAQLAHEVRGEAEDQRRQAAGRQRRQPRRVGPAAEPAVAGALRPGRAPEVRIGAALEGGGGDLEVQRARDGHGGGGDAAARGRSGGGPGSVFLAKEKWAKNAWHREVSWVVKWIRTRSSYLSFRWHLREGLTMVRAVTNSGYFSEGSDWGLGFC